MNIVNLTDISLSYYVKKQINHFFPDGKSSEFALIDRHLDESLERTLYCISKVKMWQADQFDVLHSSQYCTFLYYLANTIWQHEKAKNICTKLFFLNKSLNGIDCFYEIELPRVFLIAHSVGIVLAKATYGNYLVLYQNSTVGKNHGIAPVIEDNVILFANTAVIGRSLVKKGSVVSQGVSVLNRDTEASSLVYQGEAGSLVFKKPSHSIIEGFFRL